MPVDPDHIGRNRPFPWRCWVCKKTEVFQDTIEYNTDRSHEGTNYHLEFPRLLVAKCRNCGDVTFDLFTSDQIEDALRVKAGLLMPEDVRSRRIALGLTREELSRRIGYPEDTIGKIEERLLIQSRALDIMLRIYFAFPGVREALNGGIPDRNLGLVELSTAGK